MCTLYCRRANTLQDSMRRQLAIGAMLCYLGLIPAPAHSGAGMSVCIDTLGSLRSWSSIVSLGLCGR